MKEDIRTDLELVEGVTATVSESTVTVSGPKGEVTRSFVHPRITVASEGNTVTFSVTKGTKREKRMINTFTSHLRNMIQGVQEPHTYKLKICSGHFPMNVAVSGQELVVKNFLGESVPRKVTLPATVTTKVDGDIITVECPDKELAGQAAAKIEHICRITNKDTRIFQDGIYITHKCGKQL